MLVELYMCICEYLQVTRLLPVEVSLFELALFNITQAKERRSGENPDYKGTEEPKSVADVTSYKTVAPNIIDP